LYVCVYLYLWVRAALPSSGIANCLLFFSSNQEKRKNFLHFFFQNFVVPLWFFDFSVQSALSEYC
jgi:hypothetical protein